MIFFQNVKAFVNKVYMAKKTTSKSWDQITKHDVLILMAELKIKNTLWAKIAKETLNDLISNIPAWDTHPENFNLAKNFSTYLNNLWGQDVENIFQEKRFFAIKKKSRKFR